MMGFEFGQVRYASILLAKLIVLTVTELFWMLPELDALYSRGDHILCRYKHRARTQVGSAQHTLSFAGLQRPLCLTQIQLFLKGQSWPTSRELPLRKSAKERCSRRAGTKKSRSTARTCGDKLDSASCRALDRAYDTEGKRHGAPHHLFCSRFRCEEPSSSIGMQSSDFLTIRFYQYSLPLKPLVTWDTLISY